MSFNIDINAFISKTGALIDLPNVCTFFLIHWSIPGAIICHAMEMFLFRWENKYLSRVHKKHVHLKFN